MKLTIYCGNEKLKHIFKRKKSEIGVKLKRIKSFPIDRATEIYKAFSDESRLRILSILFHFGEICISDLELLLDYTQTKTSRHISYLKHAGLITYKKYEKWSYYEVKEEYRDLISLIIESVDQDGRIAQDKDNYKTMYGNGSLAIRKLHNRQKKYNLPDL